MTSVTVNRAILFLGFWLLLAGCTAVPSEAQTVYITKTGAKYHADGCRYLKSSQIPVSLKTAKKQGYGPCSVCSPETETADGEEVQEMPDTVAKPVPLMRTDKPEPAHKSTQTQSPAQCTAFTKAGARCKRTAGANGKCWQHQ